MPAPSDLELLMEVATRSEPRVNDDVCNQLLALAEAASQHSKVAPQWPLNPPTMYAHQSQEETPSGRECHTLPMLHIGVHYSSKDEPGSTGRYGDNTLCNPAYHSSSASPSMACAPHVLVEKAPGKQRRATRGTATGPTRDPSPSNDGQPPRKYRKYATNVPRMGRIPWIDNRHTDKKLRSKYAGVTQYQQTALWKARISCALQKQIHLGVYADEDEAARCYDRAAYHFKGDRAVLNHLNYDYARDPFILKYQHLEDKDFIGQLRARATDLLRRASMGLQTLDENTELGAPAYPPLLAPPPPAMDTEAPTLNPNSLFVDIAVHDRHTPIDFDPVNPFGSAAVKQQRSRHHASQRSGMLRPALPPQPHKTSCTLPADRAKAWGNVLMSVASAYVSTAAAIVPMVLAA